MHALTTAELLAVWEQGQTQPPVGQALALLGAACPEAPPGALAELPIGRRDALLLSLRECTFGPGLAALAQCPQCGERLELSFEAPQLRVDQSAEAPATLSIDYAGGQLLFRLPTSHDLAALPPGASLGAARDLLLERCLLGLRQGEEVQAAGSLPQEAVDAVLRRMSEADPQAEVTLAMACPACGHHWQTLFDIVPFFWAEINAWAHRTLQEVHALASAYGWREADILSMSPRRRRLYLQMAGT